MDGHPGRKASEGGGRPGEAPVLSHRFRTRTVWAVVALALLVAIPLPIGIAYGDSSVVAGPADRGTPGAFTQDLHSVPPTLYNSSLAANVSDVSIAYDPMTGTVIAVAENLTSAGTYFQPLETWSYGAGRWSQLSPSNSPSARIGASLVYDPTLGSVVLFGGLGSVGFLTDTWSFSSGIWTNITSTVGPAPPGRASAPFTWDSEDSVAVLYGGIGANGTAWSNATTGVTATWLFGAGGWTMVTQSSTNVPGALGAMTYDPHDGYVLDVGGRGTSSGCSALSTSWAFHKGVWSNLTSTVTGAPPGRWSGSASYDTATSSVILFGGLDCLSYRDDTWSYTSGHWSAISTASIAPTQRASAALVDDLATASLVLYGGFAFNGPQGDTWTYGGLGWGLQGPILSIQGGVLPGQSLVTDSGANMTIGVVGALDAGSASYTYFGLPPGCPVVDAPSFECAASQPGRYMLSGIVSSSAGESPLPTVNVLVNTPPTLTSVALSATATETGVPVTIRATVLGGTGAYTFVYSGLPMGCQSADVPVLTCDPSQVGSFNVGVAAVDSVGVEALWTEPLVVGPHPFVETVGTSHATIDVGLSTELSVIAGGGVGPLSFAYQGLPAGCASSNTTGLVCDATGVGTFTVHVTASDQFGFAATGLVTFVVHPRLSAPTLSANSSTVYLGSNVTLAVPTQGGTAPYRYSYSGLPTGCSTANASTLTCAPRATGRFVVRVTVTDALGESVTADTSITVSVHQRVPIGPPPVGGGGPSTSGWAVAISAGLAVVVASALSLGLVIRRNRRFAREGREIVAQLLDEAPRLGQTFGRLDDPTRPR